MGVITGKNPNRQRFKFRCRECGIHVAKPGEDFCTEHSLVGVASNNLLPPTPEEPLSDRQYHGDYGGTCLKQIQDKRHVIWRMKEY